MDGKNRELTSEEEAAELAKPGAHPEWETNLPADLQKSIQDYLEGIRTQSSVLDCLWDELYGSINASQWGWEISKEQADYLRTAARQTTAAVFCTQQQHRLGRPLLATVWPCVPGSHPGWGKNPTQAPKAQIWARVRPVENGQRWAAEGV